MDVLDMDASFNSSSEFDSPNTKERKKFRVVGGDVTEEERAFLIRNNLLRMDDDGEYREISTIIETDADTDEDEENVDPSGSCTEDSRKKSRDYGLRNSLKSTVDESLGALVPSRNSWDSKLNSSRVLSPLVTNSIEESSWEGEDNSESLPKKVGEEQGQGDGISESVDISEDSGRASAENPSSISNSGNIPSSVVSDVQAEKISAPFEPEEKSNEASPQNETSVADLISLTSMTDEEGSNNASVKCTPNNNNESVDHETNQRHFETPTHASNSGTDQDAKNTPIQGFQDHFSYVASTPAVAKPMTFMFSPDDNQSLASIQCPSTYSSPSDVDSPQVRNMSTYPFKAMFTTPASFLSPASRHRLNRTVELKDISYGDVADVIEANDSGASIPGSKEISMQASEYHQPLLTESTKEVMDMPVPPKIIEEILDLEDIKCAQALVQLAETRPDASMQFSSMIELLDKDGLSHEMTGTMRDQRLEDDTAEEELANSVTESKGIDAVSPVTVAVDLSLNDTSDSFAEISLDDISNESFNVSDMEHGEVDDKEAQAGPNDSFQTCVSAVSTASYGSCDDNELNDDLEAANEEVNSANTTATSNEDLDDTITIMERLLKQADQLEEAEAQARAEGTLGSPKAFVTPPRKPVAPSAESVDTTPPPIFATPKTPRKESPSNGNVFATPSGPAPRSKRVSVSKMESHYFSPTGSKPMTPALPPTPPRATPGKPRSPVVRTESSSPLKSRVRSPSPKAKVTPTRRLKSILDSPRQVSGTSTVKKTPRVNKNAPGRTNPTTSSHPIASPVANYIYSFPPPVAVKKMIPPPKLQASPMPTRQETGIPKPKLTLPAQLRHNETLDRSAAGSEGKTKPGRETINALLPEQKKGRELACNVNYVGPDCVRAVNSSFSTPSKLSSSVGSHEPHGGITPVAQRHLGVRDANNASMVTQQHAPRKFCPERFGFRSHPPTPKSGK